MGFRKFAAAMAKCAAVVVCAAMPALAQAGYVQFNDYGGVGPYALGDFYGASDVKFSPSGAAGTFTTAATNASSLQAGTANITLYNTGAGAQSTGSQKFFYVVEGLLYAEFDIDYLGAYNGESYVQRVTYNNYFAQGLTHLIPPLILPNDGTIVQGVLNPAYQNTVYFFDLPNWNTNNVASQGSLRLAVKDLNAAVAANDVPEPGTLALIGLALAGLSMVSRRRKA